MDIVGPLVGVVVGVVLTFAAGMVQQWRQREHDKTVRAEERTEARRLHWVDRRHELYAEFLGRMDALREGVDHRWSKGMESFTTDYGRTEYDSVVPYPHDEKSAANQTWHAMRLVGSKALVKAATHYISYVAVFYDAQRSYFHHAEAKGNAELQAKFAIQVQDARKAITEYEEEFRLLARKELATDEDVTEKKERGRGLALWQR